MIKVIGGGSLRVWLLKLLANNQPVMLNVEMVGKRVKIYHSKNAVVEAFVNNVTFRDGAGLDITLSDVGESGDAKPN